MNVFHSILQYYALFNLRLCNSCQLGTKGSKMWIQDWLDESLEFSDNLALLYIHHNYRELNDFVEF